MADQFKVGDLVTVLPTTEAYKGTYLNAYVGKTGEIYDVAPPRWPFQVDFGDAGRGAFDGDELAPVPQE